MKLSVLIKSYRQKNKMTLQLFAIKSGLSKQYISMLEHEKNSRSGKPIIPSLETLRKIAKAMEMTIDELLSILDDDQDISLETKDSKFFATSNEISFIATSASFTYDHYPVGIAAGMMEEVPGSTSIPKITVPDVLLGPYARNKNLCFMHINGESMNKVFENGSTIVVLRKPTQIKNGDIVVAQNGHGEYTVKRFFKDDASRTIILRPDSTDLAFTDQRYSFDDDINIFGKVVVYSVII